MTITDLSVEALRRGRPSRRRVFGLPRWAAGAAFALGLAVGWWLGR